MSRRNLMSLHNMTIYSKKSGPSTKSGYTLLFAVLISVLVLGVAVFISGTARKQYILSSTALDSMYSFYAADSGIECVAASGVPSSTVPITINCNGQQVILAASPSSSWSTNPSTGPFSDQFIGAPISEATFNIGFYPPSTSISLTGCANIKIDTYKNTSGGYSAIVQSRGYNICKMIDFTPDVSSPRTVERALQVHYY
jgi:hypothetical protein